MRTWLEPSQIDVPEELSAFVGGHPLIAETLVRRGIIKVSEAESYLFPEKYRPAGYAELPGMSAALDRVEKAIRSGETICVWGDFDVDGQTATALLVEGLRELGAQINYHIPVRAVESHGINIPNLKIEIELGASLILTCDTGNADHEPLAYAQSVGVDVVVTDHHTLPDQLPEAAALVNPQFLPVDHPLRTLPGVGVAYKLIEGLFDRAGRRSDADRFLDLVALGIVADLAELKGDTRYLLQRGLEILRSAKRVGLAVMYEVAKINSANLNEETIGFAIGPRLNALGRLGDANPIVEFLTSSDATSAKVTANILEGLNEERRLITEQIYEGTLSQLEKNPELLQLSAIVLAQENWEAGIIGIVASRLVERFNKPVVLIALDGSDVGRGSARSIEGINITEAIASQREILLNYGGHAGAAGLSIETGNIERFRGDLSHTIKRMQPDRPTQPYIALDGYLKIDEISVDLAFELDRLGPYGVGNPPLTLGVKGVSIKHSQTIGKGREHLRVIVEAGPDEIQEIVWWRGASETLPEGRFDLAFNLRMNDYRGERNIQLVWVDARPVLEEVRKFRSKRPPEMFDLRMRARPDSELLEQIRIGEVVVWGEGLRSEEFELVQREDLKPANGLAIWTIPPGADVLESVLERVKPKAVYVFAHLPSDRSAQAFLSRLAGLLNFVLREYGGQVPLRKLAGLTAQREVTVLKALDYLESKGKLLWSLSGRSILVAPGTGEVVETSEVEAQLLRLLSETAAYRRYYRRAEISQLFANN